MAAPGFGATPPAVRLYTPAAVVSGPPTFGPSHPKIRAAGCLIVREIPRAVVHCEIAWLISLLRRSAFARRSIHMPEPSNAPRRRVGVYERLRGPADGSPARMIGIGVVVLIILIVLMLVLTRYW
jgi:hypothetical protein